MANRVIADHSGNIRDIDDFGIGDERIYPYTYPFYYSGEAIPRDITDHSSNLKTVSNPSP